MSDLVLLLVKLTLEKAVSNRRLGRSGMTLVEPAISNRWPEAVSE
jgi:hypothetical protein